MIEERLINGLKPHPINERIYGGLFDHELLASIKDYGFKGTIEITKNDVIVSGHRRYNACVHLGYETIPVTVLDIENENDIVEYLIRMNQSQRLRTNEQIAREFEVLKEVEEARAKERQAAYHGNQHDSAVVENFPQVQQDMTPTGKSRDIAAKKTNSGKSGKTLDESLKVVKYAEAIKDDYPKKAEALIEKLNNVSINAAVSLMKTFKKDIADIDKAAHEADVQAERDKQLSAQLEVKSEPEPTIDIESETPEIEADQEIIDPKKTEPEPKWFGVEEPKQEQKNEVPVKKSKFNSTNDNIEWAKWSWNPVTGCKHECPYCYAKDIAVRFNGGDFNPKYHEDRINAPEFTKIPEHRINEPGIHNVFVCSMADLFGDWVDSEWIQKIIDQCEKFVQWTYLFLTKNPKRYLEFEFPENCWLGASATNQVQFDDAIKAFNGVVDNHKTNHIKFLSCEPLNKYINPYHNGDVNFRSKMYGVIDWVIIGGRSESMNMPSFQPEWNWVQDLIVSADECSIPIYFKPNLTVRPTNYPDRKVI